MKLTTTFVKGPPKFFTFNDGWTTKGDKRPASVEYAFNEFLPTLFPKPSQYEIADAPW